MYNLYFMHSAYLTSDPGSDPYVYTPESALIDPWVPPPKPTEYYTYVSAAAHRPSACHIFPKVGLGLGPFAYAAAIGFTSVARTSYKIHVI